MNTSFSNNIFSRKLFGIDNIDTQESREQPDHYTVSISGVLYDHDPEFDRKAYKKDPTRAILQVTAATKEQFARLNKVLAELTQGVHTFAGTLRLLQEGSYS